MGKMTRKEWEDLTEDQRNDYVWRFGEPEAKGMIDDIAYGVAWGIVDLTCLAVLIMADILMASLTKTGFPVLAFYWFMLNMAIIGIGLIKGVKVVKWKKENLK